MPAERTTMRRAREVLRLKFVGGVPTREIARRIGVARSTVRTTASTLPPLTTCRPPCQITRVKRISLAPA
jgi:DNA-binding NarL/FixJ family response regulator